jgi:predicted outer membrane repeat protein
MIGGGTIEQNPAVSSGPGGGIFNGGGMASMANCTVSNNQANYGGGIATPAGVLTLTNSTAPADTASEGPVSNLVVI